MSDNDYYDTCLREARQQRDDARRERDEARAAATRAEAQAAIKWADYHHGYQYGKRDGQAAAKTAAEVQLTTALRERDEARTTTTLRTTTTEAYAAGYVDGKSAAEARYASTLKAAKDAAYAEGNAAADSLLATATKLHREQASTIRALRSRIDDVKRQAPYRRNYPTSPQAAAAYTAILKRYGPIDPNAGPAKATVSPYYATGQDLVDRSMLKHEQTYHPDGPPRRRWYRRSK